MPQKKKKDHINIYLDKEILQKIDQIVKDPYNIFEHRSMVIRYCIAQNLPILEKELEEQKNKKP